VRKLTNKFNDDYDDEYNEIIDRIKRFFKAQSDMLDIEFYIFPDSPIAKRLGLDKGDKDKGFKISYHFNANKMEEPKIDIEGNIDKEKLKNYLRRMKAQGKPGLNKFIKQNKSQKPEKKKYIDANDLSFKYEEEKEEESQKVEQPLTEISHYEDYSEVILEAPGIDNDDINLIFEDNGKIVKFKGKGKNKIYFKKIDLPYEACVENCEIDANNGIIILKIQKK
jgi:HSP20 family molecular chaperone IbpA